MIYMGSCLGACSMRTRLFKLEASDDSQNLLFFILFYYLIKYIWFSHFFFYELQWLGSKVKTSLIRSMAENCFKVFFHYENIYKHN